MRTDADSAMAYFHGFPGGPAELSLFGHAPVWASHAFIPDRSTDRQDLSVAPYFDDLANRALGYAQERPLHLVGFSLGARVAMEVAVRLGSAVSRIDLISPAGPLDGTDHLKLMAGRIVFTMARSMPRLFDLQTAAQGWVARKRPDLLYRALFGRAGEQGLDCPEFRMRMTGLLHDCFAHGSTGYKREMLAYVAAWSDVPRRVLSPVTIWQGSLDNWTPPQMAESLLAQIQGANLRGVIGTGHYGTLRSILAQLGAG